MSAEQDDDLLVLSEDIEGAYAAGDELGVPGSQAAAAAAALGPTQDQNDTLDALEGAAAASGWQHDSRDTPEGAADSAAASDSAAAAADAHGAGAGTDVGSESPVDRPRAADQVASKPPAVASNCAPRAPLHVNSHNNRKRAAADAGPPAPRRLPPLLRGPPPPFAERRRLAGPPPPHHHWMGPDGPPSPPPFMHGRPPPAWQQQQHRGPPRGRSPPPAWDPLPHSHFGQREKFPPGASPRGPAPYSFREPEGRFGRGPLPELLGPPAAPLHHLLEQHRRSPPRMRAPYSFGEFEEPGPYMEPRGPRWAQEQQQQPHRAPYLMGDERAEAPPFPPHRGPPPLPYAGHRDQPAYREPSPPPPAAYMRVPLSHPGGFGPYRELLPPAAGYREPLPPPAAHRAPLAHPGGFGPHRDALLPPAGYREHMLPPHAATRGPSCQFYPPESGVCVPSRAPYMSRA